MVPLKKIGLEQGLPRLTPIAALSMLQFANDILNKYCPENGLP